jgi:hypothetical protein
LTAQSVSPNSRVDVLDVLDVLDGLEMRQDIGPLIAVNVTTSEVRHGASIPNSMAVRPSCIRRTNCAMLTMDGQSYAVLEVYFCTHSRSTEQYRAKFMCFNSFLKVLWIAQTR